MSDLSIRSEDISSAIQKMLEGYEPGLAQEQVGRVTETGDGIATISGLPGTLANELLDFGGGVFGMAMNLDEHEIGAAVFADAASIEQGQTVRRTDRVLSVPVGDALLGRV
ncbi:MAG: F0F1 ATP synthase subunit alpha, partial [Nitriliruptor sp.]